MTAAPKIESYGFGEIVIDGRRYSSDVIVYPERVDSVVCQNPIQQYRT